MTPWLLAAVMLALPLAVVVALCGRGSIGHRFAAVQLASSLGGPVLVAMTFAFAQASSMDLALILGFLTLPAGLLFAVFVERWL